MKSATKIVLVMILSTLCLSTLYLVANNATDKDVVKDVLMIFSNTAIAITAFYFKGSRTGDDNK